MLPVRLHLKNFFSHRDSEIDFTQFNSALLIGNVEGDYDRSNGSGKSSICMGIFWCLFNKTRAYAMDDVILWGEAECAVTFDFIHLEELYRVRRTRNRLYSNSNVEFYVKDGDKWVDKSKSTPGGTNKAIIDTIKLNDETFTNSIYFCQNEISKFAEAQAAKKKDILKSIVDISAWDEYEKKAKKIYSDIEKECILLSNQVENYDQFSQELGICLFNLDATKKDLEFKNKELKNLELSIERFNHQYNEFKKNLDTDSWDRAVEEIENFKSQGREFKSKYDNISKTISEYQNKISKLDTSIADKQEVFEHIIIDVNLQERMQSLQSELLKYSSESKVFKIQLKELDERKFVEGKCYVCQQDINHDLHQSLTREHQQRTELIQDKITVADEKVQTIQRDLDVCKRQELFQKKKSQLEEQIRSESRELGMVKLQFDNLKIDADNLLIKMKDVKTKIELNHKILESLKNDDFQSLHKKLNDLKSKRAEFLSEVEAHNQNIGSLTEKISNLNKNLEQMKGSKELLNQKQHIMLTYGRMIKFLGKNGIQTILLNALIEDLEATSNKILSSICNEPVSVILDTQRPGSDGVTIVETLDLKVRKDGITQNFHSLSGGEQFRISLALRIAMSEISSRHSGSNLEFLLLDEVNSPLDRYGIETLFVNVIKSLESKYKILIITHDDSIKEKFDNIIDITKVNGESSVKLVRR